MMRLSILFLLCMGQPALPGAWPRPEGTGFASATMRFGWPQSVLVAAAARQPVRLTPTSQYHTLFAEFGLTDRLTAGIDVGHSVSGAGKSIGFLRWPLNRRIGAHRFAVELGIGRIETQSVLRPGISYGYGFSGDLGSGWLAIDAVAEVFARSERSDVKLDITYGRNLPDERRLILQIQSGRQSEDAPFARLAPSYVHPIGTKRHVELGVTMGLAGDSDVGVMLGLWQSF